MNKPTTFRMSHRAGLALLLAATLAAALVIAGKPDQQAKSSDHHTKQPISGRDGGSKDQVKQVADKKQGDMVESVVESLTVGASGSSSNNNEEFVHIKPEELSAAISGDRELEAAIGLTKQSGQPQTERASSASQDTQVAEHKSAVDEELNAHLAQDSLTQLESNYAPQQIARSYPMKMGPYSHAMAGAGRPYGMQGGSGQVPRAPRPYGQHGGRHYGSRAPMPYGQPMRGPPMPYRAARAPRPAPQAYLLPPVYMNSLRGKLSSLGGPYGGAGGAHHMAAMGGYGSSGGAPIGGTRYLPRGAAAGYAAFREFVRAQANKYKNAGGALEQLAYGPQLPPMQPPAPQHPMPYVAAPETGSYQPAAPAGKPAYGKGGDSYETAAAPAGYGGEPAAPSSGKTRVTVAQAYIPHPITAPAPAAPASADYSAGSAAAAPAYGSGSAAAAAPAAPQYGAAPAPAPAAQYSAPAAPQYSGSAAPVAQYGTQQAATPMNPVLAKLYGEHGSAPPQGKHEYSKDYGMVIHYPQATVYAEPMTMEQLHKLTGNGISQILERLQYSLANGGQRDESNTLRPNNKHHIGHGFTIHAKEFYAPGKGGYYVPTTAAVISSPAGNGAYGGPQSAGYSGQSEQAHVAPTPEPAAPAAHPAAPEAEVHPAPAAAAADYQPAKPDQLGSGYERVKSAVAASQAAGKYNEKPGANKYQQAAKSAGGYEGEPLSAITNMLGSELESLFKGNAALFNKNLEPEIHSQIQAYAKGASSKQPLRFTEHSHKAPLTMYQTGGSGQGGQYPRGGNQYSGERRPAVQYGGARGGRGPRGRGHPMGPPPMMMMQQGYGGPRQMGPRHPMRRPMHPAGPGGYRQQQPRQQHQMRPNQYQQQQQYGSNAVEQAVQQQVMQLLQDFKSNEDQYYGKQNQPMQIVNQGYPNKVLQKYSQQAPQKQSYQQPQQQQEQSYGGQQQQQQQQGQKYESGTLEIPQGPNDQIGELADLVESLKGALEEHKPEGAADVVYNPAVSSGAGASYQQQAQPQKYASASSGKAQTEDLRYVSNALGQAPSYAMQVPITNGDASYSGTGSGHESVGSQYQQQATGSPAPAAPVASAQYGAQQAPAPAPASHADQQPSYGSLPEQVQASGAYGSAQATAGGSYEAPQQQQGYGQQQQQQQSYGQQQQGYGQQQQQQHQQGYGSGPASASQQSYGAGSAAPQQHQQQADGYQQQVEYQSSGSSSAGYGQQQHLTGSEFASAVQQIASGENNNGYGASSGASGYGSGAASGSSSYGSSGAPGAQLSHQPQQATAYLPDTSAQHQQQQQQQQAYQPQQQQSYSTSEHSQVINHLVPTQQVSSVANALGSHDAAQSGGAYGEQQQQPLNQISIAAPTESQYQSAQSLSSLVDSLPSEYQELLRQPASATMLDSSGYGSHAQESQTAPAAYAAYPSNATSLTASSSSGSPMLAQPSSTSHSQTYQKTPSSSSSSASSSASSSSSPASSSASAPSSQSSSAAIAATKSASSSSSASDKSGSSASGSSQIKK